jgi:hypothetical protein
MYKLPPLLLLLMPKKTISLNSVYTGYKCGKKVEMSIRDSKKYKQMHYKVCSICRDAGDNVGMGIVQGNIDRATGKIMVPTFEIK